MANIKKKFFSFLAPFVLGLSVGAAGLNAYTGHYIDELHFRIRTLDEQLVSNQSEIKQLKLNLMDKKHPILSSINVYVTVNDDTLTKLEQEQIKIETVKNVKKRLATLLGQELSKINFQQVALIIDGREITSNKMTFILKVTLLIVGTNMDMYITNQPQNKPTVFNPVK